MGKAQNFVQTYINKQFENETQLRKSKMATKSRMAAISYLYYQKKTGAKIFNDQGKY